MTTPARIDTLHLFDEVNGHLLELLRFVAGCHSETAAGGGLEGVEPSGGIEVEGDAELGRLTPT